MRSYKRGASSALIIAALAILMPVFSLAFSVSDVGATGTPPPCTSVRTDYPHKGDGGTLSVHATTNCSNVPGVTFVSVYTELVDGGYYFVNDDRTVAINNTTNNVRASCISDYYQAFSTHEIDYQGNVYFVYTNSPVVYVSC